MNIIPIRKKALTVLKAEEINTLSRNIEILDRTIERSDVLSSTQYVSLSMKACTQSYTPFFSLPWSTNSDSQEELTLTLYVVSDQTDTRCSLMAFWQNGICHTVETYLTAGVEKALVLLIESMPYASNFLEMQIHTYGVAVSMPTLIWSW